MAPPLKQLGLTFEILKHKNWNFKTEKIIKFWNNLKWFSLRFRRLDLVFWAEEYFPISLNKKTPLSKVKVVTTYQTQPPQMVSQIKFLEIAAKYHCIIMIYYTLYKYCTEKWKAKEEIYLMKHLGHPFFGCFFTWFFP